MKAFLDNIDVKRFSRRYKKAIFGRLMSGAKLRRLLNSVVVIPANNGHDSAELLPYEFCPKCGCRHTYSTGNMAPYPERWVKIYCARCDYFVATSDNSPFYHCLELKEYDYIID